MANSFLATADFRLGQKEKASAVSYYDALIAMAPHLGSTPPVLAALDLARQFRALLLRAEGPEASIDASLLDLVAVISELSDVETLEIALSTVGRYLPACLSARTDRMELHSEDPILVDMYNRCSIGKFNFYKYTAWTLIFALGTCYLLYRRSFYTLLTGVGLLLCAVEAQGWNKMLRVSNKCLGDVVKTLSDTWVMKARGHCKALQIYLLNKLSGQPFALFLRSFGLEMRTGSSEKPLVIDHLIPEPFRSPEKVRSYGRIADIERLIKPLSEAGIAVLFADFMEYPFPLFRDTANVGSLMLNAETWRDAMSELIDAAKLIVINGSQGSDGIVWECQEIRRANKQRKTIIIFERTIKDPSLAKLDEVLGIRRAAENETELQADDFPHIARTYSEYQRFLLRLLSTSER